jgi:hypothetical protein
LRRRGDQRQSITMILLKKIEDDGARPDLRLVHMPRFHGDQGSAVDRSSRDSRWLRSAEGLDKVRRIGDGAIIPRMD